MAALPIKITDFLDQVKNSDHPTAEEQEKAMTLVAETLRYKNKRLKQANDELKSAATELQIIRNRMEDIHQRLDLSIKAGLASKSIH